MVMPFASWTRMARFMQERLSPGMSSASLRENRPGPTRLRLPLPLPRSAFTASSNQRFFVWSAVTQNSNLVHFKVSGTNKSTRQLVVVNGQLGRLITFAKPAAAAPTVAEPQAARKVTEAEQLPSLQAKVRGRSDLTVQTKSSGDLVRVTGVAFIGTNQIKLDAIRR